MASTHNQSNKPPRVTIQPAMAPDQSMPLPFHIEPDGSVADQDIWKGDPVTLLGFQRERHVQRVNLLCDAFLADPKQALGMYPVFVSDNSDVWALTLPVESVKIAGVEVARRP